MIIKINHERVMPVYVHQWTIFLYYQLSMFTKYALMVFNSFKCQYGHVLEHTGSIALLKTKNKEY